MWILELKILLSLSIVVGAHDLIRNITDLILLKIQGDKYDSI